MYEKLNMDVSLTCPEPHKTNATLLQQIFREKIKKSFILLLQEAARVLKKTYQDQIDFVDTLQVERKFSLHIYYNYYSLLAYMAKNDVDNCKKLCDSLSDALTEKNSYAAQINIVNFTNEKWENNFLNDLLNKGIQGEYEVINENEFQSNKNIIINVLEKIRLACSTMYDEIINHLSLIELVKGKFDIYSASSVKYLGALPIALPDTSIDPMHYFFDVIIHEEAHSHLNIIMGLDPIVLNKQDELFLSPARKVPRPMKGIFHAHFVFYRLVYMYKMAYTLFILNKGNYSEIKQDVINSSIKDLPWDFEIRLSAYIEKYKQGEKMIKDNAKLTEKGLLLFDNMSESFTKIIS